MTKEELLVIAAAAAAFVVINIIMWSIIAARSRKEKRSTPTEPVQTAFAAKHHNAAENNRFESNMTISGRTKFVIIENTIMIHTDEIL